MSLSRYYHPKYVFRARGILDLNFTLAESPYRIRTPQTTNSRALSLCEWRWKPVGSALIDGACSSCCSRVAVSDFATDREAEELCRFADALMASGPPAGDAHADLDMDESCAASTMLHLSECAALGKVHTRAVLLFVRLVERLRRAVAYEYGLPLVSDAPAGPTSGFDRASILPSKWPTNCVLRVCRRLVLHRTPPSSRDGWPTEAVALGRRCMVMRRQWATSTTQLSYTSTHKAVHLRGETLSLAIA